MRARAAVLMVSLAFPLWASCSQGREKEDILPGHSRPVLHHDWPHPSELEFEDSRFSPPEPESVLVLTPAGTRAYVVAAPEDPLVEVTAAIPLGPHFEMEGEEGAAGAVADALHRSLTGRLGRETVASTRLAQEGGVTRLSVEVMAEDWRGALTALVATLRDPGPATFGARVPGAAGGSGFGPGAASRAGASQGVGRARAIAELEALLLPGPVASSGGDARAGSSSVRELALSALRPDAVVLGIGGGVDRADAEAALLELTQGWPENEAPSRPARPPSFEAGRIPPEPLHLVDVPAFLPWIALGHAAGAIAPEDEAAVAVLVEVVNIRLNIATREIRGLTNRALLVVPAATEGAGVWYVRTSGRPESVGPLLRYSVEELTRIRQASGEATSEELEQAKGGLALGRWQDSLDGARRTAATFASETVRRGSLEHLMAWPDAVRSVTAEGVTAAAKKYIHPEALTAVVVGPTDEIRRARHPRWPLALDEVPALLRPSGSEP